MTDEERRRRANEERDRFAARIGHEINNPLTYVLGNLELALERMEDHHPARELVGEARDGTRRIATIVARLTERGRETSMSMMMDVTTVAVAGNAKPRVLVIDDEQLIGRMIKRVLRDAEVIVLTSAREGLALLIGGDRFDLVLCDVMMPDMTGIELHADLQRVAPELLRITYFMTGGAYTPQAQSFLDSIGGARLDKPVEASLLRSLLARHTTQGR